MKLRYNDDSHQYLLDDVPIPSLTRMLKDDGLDAYLDQIPPKVVQAKAEWGTRLHMALQKAEYGYGIDQEFKQHCVDWLDLCHRMKWGYPRNPVWKKCELPMAALVEGFVFGFTPDRVAPEAVVEIKGTYSPQVSHDIQVALQVLGMGYPRSTPRYVAYFDRNGIKKLHRCATTVNRNGQEIDVFEDAYRIIFERALAWEGAPK